MRRHYISTLILLGAILLSSWPSARAVADQSIVPLGPAQPDPRAAYQAVLGHVADGGRAHWAQRAFTYDAQPYPAGTFVVPDGLPTGTFAQQVISDTLTARPSLALQADGTRVAIFRSSVSDPAYGTASWEVADVRQALDGYLDGALAYDILSEDGLTAASLARYDLLVLPAVRQSNEAEVNARIGPAGLAAIDAFVRAGGTLYAQSNAAAIAEAAGVVAAGTVDLSQQLGLAPGAAANTGVITATDPLLPLTFGWITDTLYLVNDPPLTATAGLEVAATLTNLDGPEAPAVLVGQVELGRVILIAGHPTAPTRPEQLPLFLNAALWALGSPAEITGDAVQVYNPDLDPHLLPAYEPGTPISVTLTFANLWDTPVAATTVTQTVAPGFVVLTDTLALADQATVITGTYGTQIVWDLGAVPPGEVALGFRAVTAEETLGQGQVTFATGEASFIHAGVQRRVQHRPFTLWSRMAARLVGDRDLEGDRQFFIPAEGIDLDITLPIENKEDTLAQNVVITDVIPLIVPVVNMENQELILGQNDGETVWIRNEVRFYDETGGPYLPPDGYVLTDTIGLDEWEGQFAVYDVPFGTHGELVPGPSLNAEPPPSTGNYITIPTAYSDTIKLTADHKLLLPVKVLTWTIGDWPGYYAEWPALRYMVTSSELFGRRLSFAGDPGIAPEDVVVQGTEGSIYTHLGDLPVVPADYLRATKTYVPTAPAVAGISYSDIWGRAHTTQLRAAFYDLFSWASCPSCNGQGGLGETHSSLGVTFQMKVDLDGDGVRDDDALVFPSRDGAADLDIVIKNRSLGRAISADQLAIDMGMFRGLGVSITPRSGAWATSWHSSDASTQLLTIAPEDGYDRLIFQHGLPPDGVTTITLQASVAGPSSSLAEGMLKLHDGARLTYRQPFAGPSRYEIMDTPVQGVLGEGPDVRVRPRVTPAQVNAYGDTLYLIYEIDDPDDPRLLTRNGPGDPFLQSYGFGDIAATTYVGGRQGRQILHSLVAPGEHTQLRVEIANNQASALTAVRVIPQPPPGISVTRAYTTTVPPTLYPDLPFLYAETIAEAGRGVYLFDVVVAPDYAGPRGQVVSIPIAVTAGGIPTRFHVPSAQIGIPDDDGHVARVFGPAQALALSDGLPSYVTPVGAALADAAAVSSLLGASDQASRDAIYQSLSTPVPYQVNAQIVRYDLPADAAEQLYRLVGDDRLFVITQATVQPPHAGPIAASDGASLSYADGAGRTWRSAGDAQEVEASGAAVQIRYRCLDATPGETDPVAGCLLAASTTNTVTLEVQIANIGDYPARAISATLTLPQGVSVLSSNPPATVDAGTVTWLPGDLAPGAATYAQLSVEVAPTSTPSPQASEVRPAAALTGIGDALLITQSDAQFVDARSGQVIAGRVGDALRLPVGRSNAAARADIAATITCLRATPTASPSGEGCALVPGADSSVTLAITVRNTGHATAQAMTLWADLGEGVGIEAADPPLAGAGGQRILWVLDDVEPGAERQLQLQLSVAARTDVSLQTILKTLEGSFLDVGVLAQQQPILAGAFALPVGQAIERAVLQAQLRCRDVQPRSSGGSCVLAAGLQNAVTLEITVANTGTALAAHTQAVLALAPGVTHLESSTLDLGVIDPGALISRQVTLTLTPAVDSTEATVLDGIRLNWASAGGSTPESWNHEPFSLPAAAPAPPHPMVYLPVIVVAPVPLTADPRPDLIVTRLEVTPTAVVAGMPARILVEVKNRGTAAADPFWVDLFIGPKSLPEAAGVRWDTQCALTPCDGIAWGVNGLAPGEQIILTSDAGAFAASYSQWTGALRVSGSYSLAVYADSWNGLGNTGGAVIEDDERNNRRTLDIAVR